MSRSFLDFANFDGAYRHSSTPAIATAEFRHMTVAGPATIVRISAPAAWSLDLNQPTKSTLASRRTQSDTTHFLRDIPATGGAERPVSEILVRFALINWPSESEPHPGSPANFAGEDNEAVSPRSRLPGVLPQTLRRGGTSLSVRIAEPTRMTRRVGTSVVAIKSPRPAGARKQRGKRAWVKNIWRKVTER